MTNHTDGLDAAGVTELLPCPMCGFSAHSRFETFFRQIHYFGECQDVDCTTRGPLRLTKAEAIEAWNRRSALVDAPAGETFQARVQPWMMACFGAEISSDKVERGDRLLEEVLELLQSNDYDPARVLALRDYVWSRPAGEPSQEVGGVQVTLAAYCLAFGLDMHEAGETELARIWTKVEKIRAKQAAKPVGSALPIPVASPTPSVAALQAENERLMKALAEVVIKVENDRTLWTPEWQVWLTDAKAATLSATQPVPPMRERVEIELTEDEKFLRPDGHHVYPKIAGGRCTACGVSIEALASSPHVAEGEAQPVAYASQGQMDALEDRPDDPGGVYIPLRKTQLGMFQMPLFASPRPAVSEAIRDAAEFTRKDLGETGTNYPHVRTLLAFAEAALAASPKPSDPSEGGR